MCSTGTNVSEQEIVVTLYSDHRNRQDRIRIKPQGQGIKFTISQFQDFSVIVFIGYTVGDHINPSIFKSSMLID